MSDWKIGYSMFGHYRLQRESIYNYEPEETEIRLANGIYFRRHEIPDIIEKLQHFYDTGER